MNAYNYKIINLPFGFNVGVAYVEWWAADFFIELSEDSLFVTSSSCDSSFFCTGCFVCTSYNIFVCNP